MLRTISSYHYCVVESGVQLEQLDVRALPLKMPGERFVEDVSESQQWWGWTQTERSKICFLGPGRSSLKVIRNQFFFFFFRVRQNTLMPCLRDNAGGFLTRLTQEGADNSVEKLSILPCYSCKLIVNHKQYNQLLSLRHLLNELVWAHYIC